MESASRKTDAFLILRMIAVTIVLAGIALRIAEWWHHRDLMMDEVNVVRNIYDRGFTELWKPLDYEQFAPPFFLWAVKICSLLFGYGELSLRLFPITCSCFSLYYFYKCLAENEVTNAAWYPISLFAFSIIYIQYANDIKQYASDALITILLLLFSFKEIVHPRSNKNFFWFWTIAGSVAVWTAMPGVFILAGIGISFFLHALKKKQYPRLGTIAGTAAIWLLMFGCYYMILLRHQVSSDYLQNFHEQYFLKITSFGDMLNEQNKLLLKEFFISCTGNRTDIFLYLNTGLLVAGLFFLFRKGIEYGMLVLVPILCVLTASTLHLYTLLPRVCIFIMPLLLFIIGYGLSHFVKYWKWWSAPLVIATIVSSYHSQQLKLFNVNNRIEIDELNKEIAFARQQGVGYDQIYLHPLYTPNLLYYQTIHPDKKRGEIYKQIQLMHDPYPAIRAQIKDKAAFIYFWMDDFTLQQHRDSIFSYLHPVDSLVKPSYKVLIFENR